ncbi:DUF262 domain-containing protein [Leptolyngbya sp. FACHB-541]|uniref:DUF262 domain-containing protein n=1 Tax=Leptolyngbya sp. FACHB-541 TaxID=2692810 RepID=UPI00168372BD|nr:DUF262 domain-containing protein [Leptolyngbya sp. FACHB-541]MBD1995602.1 DUF262 domain-containing protein [Leptolyngbya sp. FACHB-541]
MSTQSEQFTVLPEENLIEGTEEIGVEEDIENSPYRSKAARRVQTQPYDYAVRSLMDMIVDGDLILNPDYQRKYRWDDEKASRFVESLLLNIPVPVLYLSEEPDTKLTVIDGQQRLASLLRFTRPDELNPLFSSIPLQSLTLQGLRVLSDLNGKTFRELSQEDRSSLQKRHIRCMVILNESDPMLKFEVFERLNTGSVELTDQEVRNCIQNGPFNKLLLESASNTKCQELIELPKKTRSNMKDAELVLRFFAYRDLSKDYNSNYTEYLNEYMDENRKISTARYEELLNLFNKTVDLLYQILGPRVAFRRPRNRSNPPEGGWAHTYLTEQFTSLK